MLRYDKRMLALVLDALGALVVILDPKGRVVHCNKVCQEMAGYSLEELQRTPIWDLLVIPEEREEVKRVFEELVRTATPNQYENHWRSKDGTMHLIAWSNTFYRDPEEGTMYVIGTGLEVTDYRRTQEALASLNQKIILLHETAHQLEGATEEDDVYRLTVHAAEEILGFPLCTLDILEDDAFVPKATSKGLPPGASRVIPLSEETLEAKTFLTGKAYVLGRPEDDPSARPTRPEFCSVISVPIGEFGVFQVASEKENAFSEQDVRLVELLLGHTAQAIARIRLQRELREQAVRDALTGVYNRRYFNEVVEQEISRSQRYDHPIGFLMIDVDDFKEINDRFGHQVGDMVLQEVARLLAEQVRGSDIVVRYGGDEFLIMLIETDGETEAVAARIQEAVARRNEASVSFPFPITLSIGTAHWDPRKHEPIERVLGRADKRMYAAKRGKADG